MNIPAPNKNPLLPLSPTLTKSRALDEGRNNNPSQLKKNSKLKANDIKFPSHSAH